MEAYSPDYFEQGKQEQKKKTLSLIKIILVFTLFTLLLTCIFLIVSVSTLVHTESSRPLLDYEEMEFNKTMEEKYPEKFMAATPLPYSIIPANLYINAKSAVILDAESGNILFEKNGDMEIPPASMTKLVEMYVVFEAVKNGEVTLDDIVPLPPESWAINLPSDASIMFLAQGQSVTLRELLLGLAIASGNDASIAVANYICKDMETFVERMNAVIKNMGLVKTHFVESSGYSEKNITTAKEFAAFCRMYVKNFPEAINDYHSQKVIKYPLMKNLPKEQKHQGDGQAVIQYNTNKLLGHLEGCDGLKTGFIYESGYNIALTAEREGRRFISVTMGGPGRGSVQGNKFRIEDGTTLMEFAFSKFACYKPMEKNRRYTIGLAGSTEKTVDLVPALNEEFSVPFIAGRTPSEAAELVQVTVNIPPYIFGEVECGQQYGMLVYSLGDIKLRTIPLVADRSSRQTGILGRMWGMIVCKTADALQKGSE